MPRLDRGIQYAAALIIAWSLEYWIAPSSRAITSTVRAQTRG
jgi:hypothetical protein